MRQCIYTLRRLLGASYAIIPLSTTALLHEPWLATAALLVMPGGADLPFCQALNGPGNRLISDFVRRGGAYLGFCAGAYYGSARCEFEVGHKFMEVVGSRELAFFPGTCRGGAFGGFRYASEAGARAVTVAIRNEAFASLGEDGASLEDFRSYFNGGGVFVDAATMVDGDIEVLASYGEALDVDAGDGQAALIYCKVGAGAAILSGPHPEFAAVNLEPQPDVKDYDKLIEALAGDQHRRTSFLKACLAKLGLEVNDENTSIPSLSKLHLSALDPPEVDGLLAALAPIITKDENGVELIKGHNDTFHIENPDSRWSMTDLQTALETARTPSSSQTGAKAKPDQNAAAATDGLVDHNLTLKHIVPHTTAWPDAKETPYFNHADFYSSLRDFRRRESDAYEWGDTLLYGEVVTSTNTLLEKNPSLLAHLPTGFTMAATTQISGRGRGTNVWLAPPGCTIFSTVLNHPAHLAPTRPVVFIQYLAAIAIVEAVRSYDGGLLGGRGGGDYRGSKYSALPIKLKWPNDVYAQDPVDPWKDAAGKMPNYVKIGGILTNCAYSQGAYQMVVGVGLNTNNAKPTTSLDAVLAKFGGGGAKSEPFRSERLLARLLTRFEALYREFLRSGFTREMEERYYANWLHTDQMVTLEAEGGVRAKIVGITRDWGLLKAQEVGFDGRLTGKMWALQSDENSFDFWRGLVKRKL